LGLSAQLNSCAIACTMHGDAHITSQLMPRLCNGTEKGNVTDVSSRLLDHAFLTPVLLKKLLQNFSHLYFSRLLHLNNFLRHLEILEEGLQRRVTMRRRRALWHAL